MPKQYIRDAGRFWLAFVVDLIVFLFAMVAIYLALIMAIALMGKPL